jgi:hypothetical protein
MLPELEAYLAGCDMTLFKQYTVLVKIPHPHLGHGSWRQTYSRNLLKYQAESLAATFGDEMCAMVVDSEAAPSLLMFLNDDTHRSD